MHHRSSLWLALALSAVAPAMAKTDAKASSPKGGFSFSLLPKSFQKNPKLDFNILTEMTPEGRKRTPPTAENPAYYIASVSKAESKGLTGDDVSSHAPKQEQIERMVAQALRVNHFLPAVEGGPRPTFAMVIHWGSYSSPAFSGNDPVDTEGSGSVSGSSAQELLPLVLADIDKRKAVMERAVLIGGAAFSKELNDVLNQEVSLRNAASASDRAYQSAVAGVGGENNSSMLMSMLDASSPLAMYMRRDQRIEAMVEEVFSDSYFVVVSAIDYDSLANKKPVRLWRTKLSLSSIGVSLTESIPPLLNAGAEYFGKETEKNVMITKRITRGTQVKIGEAVVTEYLEPAKTPAAQDKDAPPAGGKK